MTTARVLPACMLLVFAGGCGDGTTQPRSSLPPGFEGLYGRWSWVRSCCGISGTPTTPQSEGFSVLYEFERSDTVRAYRDGSPWWSRDFTVLLEHQQGGTVAYLVLEPDDHAFELRLRADTLELIPDCADCPTDRFERAPLPELRAARSPRR